MWFTQIRCVKVRSLRSWRYCLGAWLKFWRRSRDPKTGVGTRGLKYRLLDIIVFQILACENIRFSSLFAAGDLSRGGTFATQRQKFHIDEANQCLHNKSSSHGNPNITLSSFMCLLVGFGKVLCSSANELKQNSNNSSREDYIPQILTVLLEILRIYIWPLWPFVFCLSFVNNS